MNTVLIINDSTPNCGVRSYGHRVGQIFKGSKKYNVIYCEPSNPVELHRIVSVTRPAFVIYNYVPVTMPWITHDEVKKVWATGTKQGLIVHNIGYAQIFDFYLHQNPRYEQNGLNFRMLRPLFDYSKIVIEQTSDAERVPSIGTFGFALPEKDYPRICQLVNEQFNEAEIRMHLTAAHFRPDQGWLEDIKDECLMRITKPGIRLHFTTDFRDDDAILDFLAGNDLNIFLYQNFPHYNGISSTVDYALSVRKPISVCKSDLFSHINDATPSICVEDSTLPEIMRNGFEPVRRFYDEWSNDKFVSHLEGVLDSL